MLNLIHKAYLLSLKGSHDRFNRALQRPDVAQQANLLSLLSRNIGASFGQQYRFQNIRSIRDFQQQIPIHTFDDLVPWIHRIEQGEQCVLTREPVKMLEPTGGSTSLSKHIPYTQSLLDDFSSATNPWLYNLFSQVEGLRGTRSYWSISLAKQGNRQTEGGIPIGFDDDTEYFNPLSRWVLNKMMAVPGHVAHAADTETWRHETVIHLLKCEDLGLISVWSPTFLTLFMDYIAHHWETLADSLPPSRRQSIAQRLQQTGRMTGEALWPQLKLISCWTDSTARPFVQALENYFPQTLIQSKGLLATEGVVTVPMFETRQQSAAAWDYERGAEVAITSHFYEFIDLQCPDKRPLLAHELQLGAQYSPVISTGGGFYRYNLRDIVTCTGYTGKTPRLRFDGKLDRVSDLCGEKLHAGQIEQALSHARQQLNIKDSFALVAPATDQQPPYYCLFLESDASDAKLQQCARVMDDYLTGAHHYHLCRKLGQLGPLMVQRVDSGWERYQQTLIQGGQRAGDIKPTLLDNRHPWAKIFFPDLA
ncbi:MAG: GH3 auxin-responsive promoter family protein [Hahellaceae bacterium]|nr:GH3 auxin-responsive promoter family protein [Hahellaceae bacterium]MCP5168867.1 GH3 auxin-responsive promoter family protein [Hahellaceae bacterium]